MVSYLSSMLAGISNQTAFAFEGCLYNGKFAENVSQRVFLDGVSSDGHSPGRVYERLCRNASCWPRRTYFGHRATFCYLRVRTCRSSHPCLRVAISMSGYFHF